MSFSYSLPLFLTTSIIVISQIWLFSRSWMIEAMSGVSEIAILLLMGFTMQLSGRLISRMNKNQKATNSEEENNAG